MPTKAEVAALLPDNAVEAISAKDVRDSVISAFGDKFLGDLGANFPAADELEWVRVATSATVNGQAVVAEQEWVCNVDATPASTPANWSIRREPGGSGADWAVLGPFTTTQTFNAAQVTGGILRVTVNVPAGQTIQLTIPDGLPDGTGLDIRNLGEGGAQVLSSGDTETYANNANADPATINGLGRVEFAKAGTNWNITDLDVRLTSTGPDVTRPIVFENQAAFDTQRLIPDAVLDSQNVIIKFHEGQEGAYVVGTAVEVEAL